MDLPVLVTASSVDFDQVAVMFFELYPGEEVRPTDQYPLKMHL